MTISQFIHYIRSNGFSTDDFFVIVTYFILKDIERISLKEVVELTPEWKKAIKIRNKWLKERDIIDEGEVGGRPGWLDIC